jgi:hypothetical protein
LCLFGIEASSYAAPLDCTSLFQALSSAQAAQGQGVSAALTQPAAAIQDTTTPTNTRALPSPLQSPPLPFTEWANEGYAPIGDSWDSGTSYLQKLIYGSKADSSRIKFYGWLDFGYNQSTSTHNNSPVSYDFMPNKAVLDQGVLRVERMPDTTQTNHTDWGFRVSGIYGTDYRYTAGDGYWFSQWQQHNQAYGADAPEMFMLYYLPKIAQGAVVMAGRYISPCDIEAQLAPYNYLYSHSLMFTVDPYTYTGANIEIRWSKNWQTLTGFQYGNDKAPWEKSAQLNAEALVGWHSNTNNDALWFGTDSIGGGQFKYGHDDLQIATVTWGHKFSSHWHFQSQMYYMWERDGELGGTENDGPIELYGGGGGPTPIVQGTSHENGFVSYWQNQVNKTDYMSYRFDLLNDPQGQRTGFPNLYTSYTIGYSHYLNKDTVIRPEIRFDNANMNPAYDNGTRKTQWTFGGDLIYHF